MIRDYEVVRRIFQPLIGTKSAEAYQCKILLFFYVYHNICLLVTELYLVDEIHKKFAKTMSAQVDINQEFFVSCLRFRTLVKFYMLFYFHTGSIISKFRPRQCCLV